MEGKENVMLGAAVEKGVIKVLMLWFFNLHISFYFSTQIAVPHTLSFICCVSLSIVEEKQDEIRVSR